MILCDTDIFIEAFKNNTLATGSLSRIGFQNIALSAITLMVEIINLDQEITETAINMIERYAKSHGLHIPDALLAATAICRGMQLLTYNVKDFKFVEGIKLYSEKV